MRKRIYLSFIFLIIPLILGCSPSTKENTSESFQENKNLSSSDIVRKIQIQADKNKGYIYTMTGEQSFKMNINGEEQAVYQKIQTLEKELYNPYASHSKGTITNQADGRKQTIPIESYIVNGVEYERDPDSGIWTQSFVGNSSGNNFDKFEKYFEPIIQQIPKGISVSEKGNSYIIHISNEYIQNNPLEKQSIIEQYKNELGSDSQSDFFQSLNLQLEQTDVKHYEITVEVGKNDFQYKKVSIKGTLIIPGKTSKNSFLEIKQDLLFTFQGPFHGPIQVPSAVLNNSVSL